MAKGDLEQMAADVIDLEFLELQEVLKESMNLVAFIHLSIPNWDDHAGVLQRLLAAIKTRDPNFDPNTHRWPVE